MDTMNLKPKYNIGQKLIYIKPSSYNGNLDCITCYPVTIQAITIYENCIKYIDNEFNEIGEIELVPYNANNVGEYIINEIERNINENDKKEN